MRRLLLLALVALASCSTAPPRVGEPPPHVADSQAEADYQRIFAQWTRRTEVYDLLDTRMFLAATLESTEFRRAKAERIAMFQQLPTSARDVEIARELAEGQKGYDFFLGVHTDERRYNDFDRPSSIWRVAMHTSAGEVTPVEIERIRPDPNVRGVYLFLGDFWVGYRVRFPVKLADGRPTIAPDEHEVSLRLASAVGHAELVFPAAPLFLPQLAPPPVAVP